MTLTIGSVIACTGHRPPTLATVRLPAYSKALDDALLQLAKDSLRLLQPKMVIAGGALGWDTAAALASLSLGIPLRLALPCHNQERKWPPSSQERYRAILNKVPEGNVYYAYEGDYPGAWCMTARDKYMVDNCEILLALYNQEVAHSGTGKTVQYAQGKGITVHNVWPQWLKEVSYQP